MAEQAEHKGIDIPSSTPTQETFDLGDFIQEKSTVPIVGVTVYLDADGGRQLQEQANKLAEISEELEGLEGQAKPTLGIAETDPNVEAVQRLTAEQATVKNTIDELKTRVLGSALYVEFQCKDLKIPSEAKRLTEEEMPDAENNVKQERGMTHMMGMMCARISRVDGKTINGPRPVDEFEKLRNALIVTEATKLVEGVTEALMISNEWTSQIDAGFLGRSTDLAG